MGINGCLKTAGFRVNHDPPEDEWKPKAEWWVDTVNHFCKDSEERRMIRKG